MTVEFSQAGFIETMNKTGFVISHIDEYMQAFIDRGVNEYPLLEIGAGYGFSTLRALEKGHKIICNDLSNEHLNVVKEKINQYLGKYIKYVPGKLPDDLLIEKESISAILISRVLHFFNGTQLDASLVAMKNLLIPGGKVYAIVETPYLSCWKPFHAEFSSRLRAGDKYPGLMNNHKKYDTVNMSESLPETLHLFNKETLSRLFSDAGFLVEKCNYMSRSGVFPNECLSETGQDSVGIIAVRP